MDAKQRRQARRQFKKQYPYVVTTIDMFKATSWCNDNCKKGSWAPGWKIPYPVDNEQFKPLIRFAKQEDAVYFALMM